MTSCVRVDRFLMALLLLAAGCRSVPDPAAPQTNCAADDPRVGMTAELSSRLHGVRGTARIVDNCTVVIENFTYDGIGIDVRVVGFKNSDIAGGVPLTRDIRRPQGYSNETLVVPLPENETLDDMPEIGIVCVTFNASFGEGTFH
jgi:hypothetical protein